MKITHSLISAASALAILAGSATPALAYRRGTPPVATTVLRQRSEVRELYADAYSSILELSNSYRGTSVSDTTGRSMLARAQVRAAQRNFRRHVLGYLRGVDYRVLNISGDVRLVAIFLPQIIHGQSRDGLMKDPWVTCASCQNSEAAMGSPSIGVRMMLTGTLRGNSLTAWRYNFCRSRPLML